MCLYVCVRERERKKERERDRERETERQRETERDRETERETSSILLQTRVLRYITLCLILITLLK